MKLKGLSCVASLLAIVTLASCGSQASSTINPDDIGYQYADPTKPVVATANGISFNIMAPKDPLAKNYADMQIIKNINAQTNVNVNWTHPASYSLETIMVSGNLPDAIYHAGFTDPYIIQYGVKRNKIVAIDNYLDKMPYFSKILEKNPEIRKEITVDGHIYALPRIEEMGLVNRPNLLFINKDWLGKLIDSGDVNFISKSDLKDGLKLTLAQFKQVLALFQTNKMGAAVDTDEIIPLDMIYNNWQGNISDLYAAYGAYYQPDFKTLVNGEVICDLNTDAWRNATVKIHDEFFKTGLIPEKAFEQTQQQLLADGKGTEKIGAFYYWEKESVVANQDNYICMEPLVGTDGQRINLNNNHEVNKGEVVVFSTVANPDILLTYLDRYYETWNSAQLNYGAIGEAFEQHVADDPILRSVTSYKDENGNTITADDFRLRNAPMGLTGLTDNVWYTGSEAAPTGETSYGAEIAEEDRQVEMEPRAKTRRNLLDNYESMDYVFPGQEVIPNIVYTADEIQTLQKYEVNLGNAFSRYTLQYLKDGGLENDANWNKLQSDLASLHLPDVLNINNSGYQRLIAD